jgi:hypothetical protein
MALKVIKECQICENDCKQIVDEKIWDHAQLLYCPQGKKQKKKRKG